MIFNMTDEILTPCNVACGSGIVTVNSPNMAAPCNVIRGSGCAIEFAQTSAIMKFLHLFSISTTLPQSTCHSAPVSETGMDS